MKARLENQIAIVTASSSGNGRAIALALSSEGATVVCADLSKNARKEGYEEDIEIDTADVIRLPNIPSGSRFFAFIPTRTNGTVKFSWAGS